MLGWPSTPATRVFQTKLFRPSEDVMVVPAPAVSEVIVTTFVEAEGVQPVAETDCVQALTPTLPFKLIAFARFEASVAMANEIGKCKPSPLVPATPPLSAVAGVPQEVRPGEHQVKPLVKL